MTQSCCIKSIESSDTLCRSCINSTKNHNPCEILYMISHSAHKATHAFCIIRSAYKPHTRPTNRLCVLYYTKRIQTAYTPHKPPMRFVLYEAHTNRIHAPQIAPDWGFTGERIAGVALRLCLSRYPPCQTHSPHYTSNIKTHHYLGTYHRRF